MPKRAVPLLLLALLALGSISPAWMGAWSYREGALRRLPLPPAGAALAPAARADFDRDGRPESLALEAGRAHLRAGGQVLWSSPPGWQVIQAQAADLNRDGLAEAALLLWRPAAPWPIDRFLPWPGPAAGFHDRSGLSCHLILVGWKRGAYRELWAGSALERPLRAFAAADLDGDGRQELAALESDYAVSRRHPAASLAIWEWNGFGFSLRARAAGRFERLEILDAGAAAPVVLAQEWPF